MCLFVVIWGNIKGQKGGYKALLNGWKIYYSLPKANHFEQNVSTTHWKIKFVV